MDPEKLEELKAIIEGEAYNQYDDQMKAKENIDILAKAAKGVFLIEPGIFKKLVKFHYEKSMENERRKFSEVDDLYIEIFGEPEPELDLFSEEEIKEDSDPINNTIDKDEVLDKIKYGAKRNKNQ